MKDYFRNSETMYCYELSTGTIIKSNDMFNFDAKGNSNPLVGEINGKFYTSISVVSSSIILQWIDLENIND